MDPWKALEDYLSLALRHERIEKLMVLFLDRNNGLIRDEIMQQGTVDHVPAFPCEIARRALQLGASAVIIVHNHPSGDPTPSKADIEMTKQTIAALAPLGIAVHDHVIVGRNKIASLPQAGWPEARLHPGSSPGSSKPYPEVTVTLRANRGCSS